MPHRKVRVLTVGTAAAVCLYVLAVFVAEPFRAFGATDSDTVVVSLTVASAISQTCDSSIGIGTITSTGDSSSNNGYDSSDDVTCTVITNNSTGYLFGWRVATGTGAAGARTGTGHLNGFDTGNRIRPLTPTNASTPEVFNTSTISATEARWAGRLSSTSTTNTGAGMTWGTDVSGANDKWLNVATGSTVNIAKRTTETSSTGDVQVVAFRAIIGSSAFVPTDTYKATVTFTVTTN